MEITKHNFKENFPKIKEAIKTANFISIDGEFTGIASQRSFNHFDTPEERYQKLKESSGSSYLLIQFGLCTFHYDQETDSYRHKAFNFYIFPRQNCRPNQEVCFLSQPSSLEFLLSQGFDFNKLIRDGIPFMATEASIRLRSRMQEKHKDQLKQLTSNHAPNNKNTIPVPEENMAFIKQVEQDIQDLLDNKEKEHLDLLPCNAFLRRLVYELVDAKYPKLQTSTKSVSNSREKFLRVEKKCEEPDYYIEELKNKHKLELVELEDSVGFCKVISAISEANTLLVGHNMLLDVINLLRQFVCPLPENYKDFKSLVKCALNSLVDTKLISSSDIFKETIDGTGLQTLVSQLQAAPFKLKNIEPCEGFEGYVLNKGKLHEAGYDAYLTGAALIGLHNFLSKSSQVSEPITHKSKLLAPYLNKVFMMQSYDLNCFNLGEEDKLPSRSHIFYVQFPKDWKTNDLVELFSKYGNVYISWLNDTSAYVALRRPENAPEVCQELVGKSPKNQVSVVPYSPNLASQKNKARKHSLDNNASHPPSKKAKTSRESWTPSSTENLAASESVEKNGHQTSPQVFAEPEKWE